MGRIEVNINELPPVNRRLYEFAINKSGSINSFAKSINQSQPRINSLFNISIKTGRYPTIQSDIIEAICRVYDLDIDWLFKGREKEKSDIINIGNNAVGNIGNIRGNVTGNIMSGNGNVVNIPNFNGQKIIETDGKVELHDSAQSVIEKLEVENNSLKNEVALLREMVNMKDKIISMLEKKLTVE